jgi:hypothetical protein
LYGITPDEEFRPRLERLREQYASDPTAVIKDQCNLISTVSGNKPTTATTNAWWRALTDIEASIGIARKDINDGIGGSYRTYHDHILLQTCSDPVMRQLQFLRLHGTEEEKQVAIAGLMDGFRKQYKSKK